MTPIFAFSPGWPKMRAVPPGTDRTMTKLDGEQPTVLARAEPPR
jgi:hypothetical protein